MSVWDFISGTSQTNKRSDPAIGGSEGKRRIQGGITGDIFNLLNRPNSTITGSILGELDDDPETSFTQGLKDGITGRSQHNWSEVLGEMGVTNPIAKAVGGFVGDVALDPLTYVGLKSAKGLNTTEALSTIAREATESGVQRTGKEFSEHVAQRMVEAQRENPAHMYVSFAGKRIGPKFEAPVKIARAGKDFVIGPEAQRRTLARAFSMDSEQPFGLAEINRVSTAHNQALYHRGNRAIDNHLGFLTPEQAKSVSFAIDTGEDLTGVPTDFAGKDPVKGFETLQGVKNYAQGLMDWWAKDEIDVGQMLPEMYRENYIPRYFKEEPAHYPGLSRAAKVRTGNQAMDAQRRRLLETKLQHLYETGGKNNRPEVDIRQILKQRQASHYRKVGRAQMVEEPITRFSVSADKDGVNKQWLNDNGYIPTKHIASPTARLYDDQNLYMPQDVVNTINRNEELLTDNLVGGRVMKGVDTLHRNFKFLNTALSPGYWIRNSLSDALMNVSSGVVDPKYYKQALKIMQENRGSEADEFFNELLDRGAREGNMDPAWIDQARRTPKGRTKVNLGGQVVDTDVAWDRYLKSGGKSGDITSSNLTRDMDPEAVGAMGRHVTRNVHKAAQRGSDFATKLADAASFREDFFRLPHYLAATEKGVKNGIPWQDALNQAGEQVRKYNIDYGKMTKFEKNVAKRAIPFYSWTRRNLPLQAQMLFTRPGFMASYAKFNDLAQGVLGADDGEGDMLIPEWIRNSMPVRAAMGKQESNNPLTKAIRFAAGAQDKEAVFSPLMSSMTPAGDLLQLTKPIQEWSNAGGLKNPGRSTVAGGSEFLRSLLSQSSPLLKGAVEIGTQRSTYNGAPIDDWGKWAWGQVTPTRTAYNVSQQNTPAGRSGLTSWLTGLNLQAVSEGRQKGESKRREDVIRGRGLDDKAFWDHYLAKMRRQTGTASKSTTTGVSGPKRATGPTYKRVY